MSRQAWISLAMLAGGVFLAVYLLDMGRRLVFGWLKRRREIDREYDERREERKRKREERERDYHERRGVAIAKLTDHLGLSDSFERVVSVHLFGDERIYDEFRGDCAWVNVRGPESLIVKAILQDGDSFSRSCSWIAFTKEYIGQYSIVWSKQWSDGTEEETDG